MNEIVQKGEFLPYYQKNIFYKGEYYSLLQYCQTSIDVIRPSVDK